jgi:hypothetical protein
MVFINVTVIRNALPSKTVNLTSNFNVKSVSVYITETHLEHKYTHQSPYHSFVILALCGVRDWFHVPTALPLECETPPQWYPFRSLGEPHIRSGLLRKQNNPLFLQGIEQRFHQNTRICFNQKSTNGRQNLFHYKNCDLRGHYAASSGNFLPMFRGNLSVSSSRVKNNPEERGSHLLRGGSLNSFLLLRCVATSVACDQLSLYNVR